MELESTLKMSNSSFANMQISVMSCFNSILELDTISAEHLESDDFIIYWFFCSKIIFKKVTLNNCTSNDIPGVIYFVQTTVNLIENSVFTNNQLRTLILEQSVLASSINNTFDGINKGIKFDKKSIGKIQDSIFLNMIQDIREGSIYQSNIVGDGSAIGTLSFLLII